MNVTTCFFFYKKITREPKKPSNFALNRQILSHVLKTSKNFEIVALE